MYQVALDLPGHAMRLVLAPILAGAAADAVELEEKREPESPGILAAEFAICHRRRRVPKKLLTKNVGPRCWRRPSRDLCALSRRTRSPSARSRCANWRVLATNTGVRLTASPRLTASHPNGNCLPCCTGIRLGAALEGPRSLRAATTRECPIAHGSTWRCWRAYSNGSPRRCAPVGVALVEGD